MGSQSAIEIKWKWKLNILTTKSAHFVLIYWQWGRWVFSGQSLLRSSTRNCSYVFYSCFPSFRQQGRCFFTHFLCYTFYLYIASGVFVRLLYNNPCAVILSFVGCDLCRVDPVSLWIGWHVRQMSRVLYCYCLYFLSHVVPLVTLIFRQL